jgi:hypothetical protein
VEQAPLQVYYSTLMFTLTNSVVKQQFYKLLTWVEPDGAGMECGIVERRRGGRFCSIALRCLIWQIFVQM